MCGSTKYIYHASSENVNGQPIVVSITTHGSKTKEISAKYDLEQLLGRKFILLSLITIINLISFLFEVITTNLCIVMLILVLFIIYKIMYTVKEEKLLIVESLGYQFEVTYIIGKNVRYVAWSHVKSVFINEVVNMQRVIFILAILTKATAKEGSTIIPLFSETLPMLQCLEVIYQCIENGR